MGKILFLIGMILCTATVLFGAGSIVSSNDDKNPVKTVDSVDLSKYTGKWFEIARYPNRFQNKCAGEVTAKYSIKKENRLEVLNECAEADGDITKAVGEAKIVDKETNAKLKVRFAPGWLSWLPFVWGDYWILELDEDYRYSVVGSPDRDYLWILSREPQLDEEIYSKLLVKIEKLGFDPNKLVKTRQE
ncbi:MAG: lipocalin family protein [Pyrinomonadaceae bacterium]